ncbi:unnamed protein product [Moneuplotes crassus]|uniref:Uncharacterized protein n=1 Tax=Euplotes crassus TaxID=5936 RepID=A0AAD1UPY4_EUPCR|nr:unnamed protein product [Moneuplotes crassus]
MNNINNVEQTSYFNGTTSHQIGDLSEVYKGQKNMKIEAGACVQQKSRMIRIKTSEEIEFLEEQFKKDPVWSRKTVQYCKKFLKLRTHQIYKWGFDKKKNLKRMENEDKASINRFFDAEFELSKIFPVRNLGDSIEDASPDVLFDSLACPEFDYNKIVDELVRTSKKLHNPNKFRRSDLGEDRKDFCQEKFSLKNFDTDAHKKEVEETTEDSGKDPMGSPQPSNLFMDLCEGRVSKETSENEHTFKSSQCMIYDSAVHPFLEDYQEVDLQRDYIFEKDSFLFKDCQAFLN